MNRTYHMFHLTQTLYLDSIIAVSISITTNSVITDAIKIAHTAFIAAISISHNALTAAISISHNALTAAISIDKTTFTAAISRAESAFNYSFRKSRIDNIYNSSD